MIGKTIKRFEIQSALGAGGMGKVYLARDTKLNRPVALKFISADLQSDAFRKRFMHEAQAIAALNHPNVVTIHEIDEHEGQPFIVLEHVDGQSLESLLAGGSLEKTRALEIVCDVARGLEAAHGVGVIHRDIKPSNIIITKDGRAKILDFGLARLAGATRLTQAETTLGTLHYRSPEQVGGDNSDHRSDLFSLGAVLYEALTGEVPFGGEYEAAVVYSIAHEAPAALQERAPEAVDLQPLIDRALAKDPAERFQTAAEFVEAVEEALAGRAPAVTAIVKSKVRWPRVVVAAAVLITALSVWQGWRLLFDGSSGAEPRLALLAMENLADPADNRQLGRIALSLLATDLADAGQLQIIDPQRISDALRKHGHNIAEINDPPVRQQILSDVQATLALQGSILQVTPRLILTASLVDALNDKTIALKRITGQEGENIFEVVDRLTDSVKLALSLPVDTVGDAVSDKTTFSEEAYREYIRGMDLQIQFFDDRAEEHFRRALSIDSTFAMAHYGISLSRYIYQQEQMAHIESAYANMSRTTRQNQYLIRARYEALHSNNDAAFAIYDTLLQSYPDDKLALFFYGLSLSEARRWQEAHDNYRRVISIDPNFADGYIRLGYATYWLGEPRRALELIDSAIALEPTGNPNVYDSKGEIAGWIGDAELAREYYFKALEVDPTFGTRWSLAELCALIGDHQTAESLMVTLATQAPFAWGRANARGERSLLPLLAGKPEQSLRELNEALIADKFDRAQRSDQTEHMYDYFSRFKYYYKAVIFERLGLRDSALAAAQQAEGFHRKIYVRLLAEDGRLDQADSIRSEFYDVEGSLNGWNWHPVHSIMQADIALGSGDTAQALRYLDDAQRTSDKFIRFRPWYQKAMTYYRLDSLDAARVFFDSAANYYFKSRFEMPFANAEVHYYLADVCERIGDTAKARAEYQRFLNIWPEPDSSFTPCWDARERLERLN